VGALAHQALAISPVATYQFNNTFAADQGGAPALTATDPLAASAFVNDTVFGNPRTVWDFDGTNAPSTLDAGLTVDTTGLVAPQSYSVDMVFLFKERDGQWRRIIDVQNRQSDTGFYVDPSDNLDIFPVSGSTADWTNNVYHHVALTNDGTTAIGYLDGVFQFTAPTGLMNLDNVNNPGLLMNFFLDNTADNAQEEFSDGRVALIRLWDGILTGDDVAALAANPFVPEPSSLALALVGLGAGGLLARKKVRAVRRAA
jgi:hypothetical protein